MPALFSTPIEKPFDPAKLKVEVKNTTISQLCEMLKNEIIDLQPDFQRHANLWLPAKKSRLIESLILGLPIPSFYFYIDSEKKKWVVIDGLQRLCALKDFMVDKTLRLSGLELIEPSRTGCAYEDFSYYEQVDISMRSVTLNIISGDASDEAKYIIFKRLNSENTSLKPAEIRNALYHGPSMAFVKELADSYEFQEATDKKVSAKRLMTQDYVSRFLAFYLRGYNDYEDDKMDLFIGGTLTFMNKQYTDADYETVREVFNRSLFVCKSLLGSGTFRKPLTEAEKKNKVIGSNPISISLFEAMMCSVAKLSKKDITTLLSRKYKYQELYEKKMKDSDLVKHLSSGTNKYKSVVARFSGMEDVVCETLR